MFDRLFQNRQNKSSDLISWFENKINLKYPRRVKELLIRLTQKEPNIEIFFEAANFGQFKVLDFKSLSKIRNGSLKPSSREESMSNPFFLISKISSFIERYVPNNHELKTKEVLPFARATYGDRTTYVYFINKLEEPIRLNIDYEDARPRKVGENASDLIDIENILIDIEKSEKLKFNFNKRLNPKDIVPINNIFIGDPECVDHVSDYRKLIELILNCTSGNLILNGFSGEEIDNKRIIKIKINNKSGQLILKGNTDWVDNTLIDQLNSIIFENPGDNRFIEFYDSNWGQEFGVIYGNDEKEQKLKMNGYIGNWYD
jgi:hypothetical protein